MAKRVAEGSEGQAKPQYLGEASLSYLARKTTEARSKATGEWIRDHVGKTPLPLSPRGRLHKGLGRVRNELAGRFY